MKKLTVIYDSHCGFCARCRWWLAKQPKYVTLEFVPAGAPEIGERFPDLTPLAKGEELVVVNNEGWVYRGSRAWLICLWATRTYREWAIRLATPILLPLTRSVFTVISGQRHRLSDWLGLSADAEIEKMIRSHTKSEVPGRKHPPADEGWIEDEEFGKTGSQTLDPE